MRSDVLSLFTTFTNKISLSLSFTSIILTTATMTASIAVQFVVLMVVLVVCLVVTGILWYKGLIWRSGRERTHPQWFVSLTEGLAMYGGPVGTL